MATKHFTDNLAVTQETLTNTIELTNGETVPVADGADPECYRRYIEALVQPRTRPAQRKTRRERGCPNGNANYTERVLWRRNGKQSYMDKAPVEVQSELPDVMVIIHSAGGVTTMDRNGTVSYE